MRSSSRVLWRRARTGDGGDLEDFAATEVPARRRVWLVGAAVFVVLSIVFALCVFGWISYVQSYMADDYVILLRTQDTGLWDYMTTGYREWNGRIVPNAVSWIVIPHRKVFAVLNTAVLVGIVLLVFRVGSGRWPRRDARDMLMCMAVFAAVWFGAAQASDTLVWRIGAFNYSWMLVLALGFLVPFRTWIETARSGERMAPSLIWTATLIPLGFTVGASHEQVAVATAWVVMVFFAAAFRVRLLKAVPVQLYAAALGLFAGAMTLLLAPGYMKRLATEPEWASGQRFGLFRGFLTQTLDVTWQGAYPWFLLILVLGVALSVAVSGPRRTVSAAWMVPAAACLSAAVVVLLPLYRAAWSAVGRATFVSFGFVLLGLVCLVFDKPTETVLGRLSTQGATMLMVVIAVVLAFDSVMQYRTTAEMERWLAWRNTFIVDAVAAGGIDVEVPTIPMPIRRFQYIADFADDPAHWYNAAAAEYYGVASITRRPEYE